MKKPEEEFNKQEIIALEMAKFCKGLAMELVNCLSESDSVKVRWDNRPYGECAKEQNPKISSECVGLRETYFNCKRGQSCLLSLPY
ncbi:uncharacterized protein LOC111385301 [Olea europaea var. sylvestris]|uniref:uncharacterized protein LOC111385301 n=1 Tax=Olea europaea var. sylvestris TaxID=158386 RepID=UPI000C1D7C53|nr:uncharacterized protein LOC111385301 [Olea europaea var. sylvestris]